MTDANRLKLYEAAVKALGKDASPKDKAPDELACAETINELHKEAFGEYISPENILSTYYLFKALRTNPAFKEVYIPAPGDIVISPTGYTSLRTKDGFLAIPNGHAGIIMLDGKIASNDSRDGVFRENYTLASWSDRYVRRGGYFMRYYRRV